MMAAKIKAFGEVMMRLEVPNHLKLEQTRQLDVMYAGTGVNILGALSRYGHETALISKLPQTALGDAAIRSIRSLGIGTENIVRGGDFLGMYFLEKGFDVRASKVTYSDRLASSFNTADVTDYELDSILENTTMLHFCGIALAMTEKTRETTIQLARRAKELGITIVFDNNYRPKLWNNDYDLARKYYDEMLELADICFMSDKDAQLLLGFSSGKCEKKEILEDLLSQVAQRYRIDTIACTIRNHMTSPGNISQVQGFVLHNGEVAYSREYTFQTFDRIGAGDGFASGVLHGLVHHFSIDELVEFSTAAGVLAHTTYGDTPISSQEEVWNFVHQDERIELER